MKTLILGMALMLIATITEAQVVMRTDTIMADTLGNPVLTGVWARPTQGEFFLPTEEGIYLFYFQAIVAPAAQQVMGSKRSVIFIPKDSIPTFWNQAKDFYINNMVPILQDSIVGLPGNWREILVEPIQ